MDERATDMYKLRALNQGTISEDRSLDLTVCMECMYMKSV